MHNEWRWCREIWSWLDTNLFYGTAVIQEGLSWTIYLGMFVRLFQKSFAWTIWGHHQKKFSQTLSQKSLGKDSRKTPATIAMKFSKNIPSHSKCMGIVPMSYRKIILIASIVYYCHSNALMYTVMKKAKAKMCWEYFVRPQCPQGKKDETWSPQP